MKQVLKYGTQIIISYTKKYKRAQQNKTHAFEFKML